MPETDFLNQEYIFLRHPYLSAYFRSITNKGTLLSEGKLMLESSSNFLNEGKEAKISAKSGLFMKAMGIHMNLGGLYSQEGENIVSACTIHSNNGVYEGKHIIQNAQENNHHQGVLINSLSDIQLIAKKDVQFLSMQNKQKDISEIKPIFQKNFLKAGGILTINAGEKVNAEVLESTAKGPILICGTYGIYLKSYLNQYYLELIEKTQREKTFDNPLLENISSSLSDIKEAFNQHKIIEGYYEESQIFTTIISTAKS